MDFTNEQPGQTTEILTQDNLPQPQHQPLSLDIKLPGAETETPAPATTTEQTPAPTTTEEVKPSGPTYEELLAENQTLKTQAPQKEYVVPEPLTEFYNNIENFTPIIEAKAMSDLDVWKNKVASENPWATTPEYQMDLIKKEFPDFDPTIPENYGMEPTDYAKWKYGTDSHRQSLVAAAQAKVNEGASAIRSQSIPQPPTAEQLQKQADEFGAKVESYVDEAISGLDLSSLPTVEGIKIEPVDMAKVREDVLAGRGGFIMDKNGMFWPDAQGTAYVRQLEAIVKAIPSTIESLKRVDPTLAAEAVKESLRNPVPATGAPAPATHAQANRNQQPVSLNIIRAQNNT